MVKKPNVLFLYYWNIHGFKFLLQSTDSIKTIYSSFFDNLHLIRQIEEKIIYKKFGEKTRDWTQITCLAARYSTITLECFLCLCEAVIESYSCKDDSVQFI